MHVVHFCFGEGEGVVGAGGEAGEVFARREVVDVIHAVGAQAHPLDEVVAVAVFGESGAVVFEPEEGRGGYSADRDHEYGQRHGERDEGCAELEEARGVFYGVFAGCGAFCSFGRGCQGRQRRVGVRDRVGVTGAGGFGAVLASGGGGACRLRGSDGFCFSRIFGFCCCSCCCSCFCFGCPLHGFAVEVAERRIFGGALRVAHEGHEAGGDVGAGAYAGADALFAEFAACGDDGYGAGRQVGFFGDGGYVCYDASEGSGVRCRFAGHGLCSASFEEFFGAISTDGRAQCAPHSSVCFFAHGSRVLFE